MRVLSNNSRQADCLMRSVQVQSLFITVATEFLLTQPSSPALHRDSDSPNYDRNATAPQLLAKLAQGRSAYTPTGQFQRAGGEALRKKYQSRKPPARIAKAMDTNNTETICRGPVPWRTSVLDIFSSIATTPFEIAGG